MARTSPTTKGLNVGLPKWQFGTLEVVLQPKYKGELTLLDE